MNSRERVITAMRRQGVPDRVPLQFDLSRPLIDIFSEKYAIPAHYTTSYYEDLTYRISANELRIAMGSDCVVVGAGLPAGYAHKTTSDGCIVNEFGMKMRQGQYWMDVVDGPFSDGASVQQVLDHPFPDPLDESRYDDAKRYIDRYKGDYFIIGDIEVTMFDFAWHLVGLERFLSDMATGEPYIEALIDRCMDFSLQVGKRLIQLGVDGIWGADDFGAQNGMMISPAMFRRIFKPRLAALVRQLRAVNNDVLVMYHSDGAIAPILGDLIEIGVDVFNPVQPNVPGHEPAALKAAFGRQLSFWGAIDQQYLLPRGTAEEIDQGVASVIRVLGEGGGYMCAPAHILQADTPVENIEAFIAAVRRHGDYGLGNP
jgi:uroporphyrinogen decarboxylase